MAGTVEVECQQINRAGNYIFAMNIFDVVVGASNPKDKEDLAAASRPLGYDMYFEQTKAGQIVNVKYQFGDKPYYVEVKLGAINSFHTSVIAPSSHATVDETDVVGDHSSLYSGALQGDKSLSLTKGFDQTDFSAFVDPHLSPSNVVLKAQASTNIHPNGYIQATSVSQSVLLAKVSAPTKMVADGWDSQLSAHGTLSLKIKPNEHAKKRIGAAASSERLSSSDFVSGDLKSIARLVGRTLSPAQSELSSEQLEATLSSEKLQAVKLRRASAHFRSHQDAVIEVAAPLLNGGTLERLSLQRLFAVLADANVPSAHDLLIRYGIDSTDERTQLAALNTISTSQVSSALVRDALWALAKNDKTLSSTVVRAAVLAYGSVLSRSPTLARKMGIKQLMALKTAAAERDDEPAFRTISSALYNTLPVPLAEKLPPTPPAGTMPFNRSWSASAAYGSLTKVGAKFGAEYFVGTNFDCNRPSFNYMALASTNGTVNLFSFEQSVFNVYAVYGREGKQVVGNELYLQVFFKVIVDKQIPNEDCKSHTYDLGSFTAPGATVAYTLWVGCIPVIFEAGVHFEADLSWGWSVCQNNLSAQVSATPSAKLTASASAQADLLIIEGEVYIEADFAVSITPRAFVDGALCSVGVDVTLTADPMEASVVAEYRKKKCEWWIFDCKWSDWTKDTLWSWNSPIDNKVLFQQTWPIKP